MNEHIERPITVEFSMTATDRYKVVAVYRSVESAQAACAVLSQRTEQQAGAAEPVAVISERGLRRLAEGKAHCVHAYAKVVDEDDVQLYRAHPPAAEPKGMEQDAARYRWLREQDWFRSPLCVLRDPKKALIEWRGLGADCPSLDRLDAAIDATLAADQKGENDHA
jgi:hypothetical protein